MIKRFLKDIKWLVLILVLLNIAFLPVEGFFKYSLLITGIIYINIIIFRIILKVFLKLFPYKEKKYSKNDTNYVQTKKEEKNDYYGDWIHFFMVGGSDHPHQGPPPHDDHFID